MSATGGLRLAVEGLVAELVVELNRFFLLCASILISWVMIYLLPWM